MTTNELRTRLQTMNEAEKTQFYRAVGAGIGWNDDRIIEMYIKEPAWQNNICDTLGVPTKADLVAEANIASATYAKRGFNISVWALVIAGLSAALSLVALFK